MIFCDGHVHIHGCYPIDRFLSAAIENFHKFRDETGRETENAQFVLWLTESAGADRFAELARIAASPNRTAQGEWRFRSTREPISLIAEHPAGEIVMVAGRQIVCTEKIEVLALGSTAHISDGMPIADTIRRVLSVDGLPVLPWGFGKWIGQRGRIVEQLVKNTGHIYLGDNGGRMAGLPEPRLFRVARHKNVAVLPGTDPLPFQDEYQRVASYGWFQEGTLDPHRPVENLKDNLRRHQDALSGFGRLQKGGKFAWNQIRMQLRKRLP